MTPEDRRLAREALESGRLTIEQMTALREVCERTGRPLVDVAREQGLALEAPRPPVHASKPAGRPGPALPPRLFLGLLAACLVLLLAMLWGSVKELLHGSKRDEELAAESLRLMAEAERMRAQVQRDYERNRLALREQESALALNLARKALAAAEARAAAPRKEKEQLLMDAVFGFNTYLELHAEEAGIYLERARAHQLRGNPERAIADLEKALSLDRNLEPAVAPRLAELRR
jgi:tetratricopeptide (TPR) repeat protein